MEAPEKIYLYPSDRAGEEYEDEWYTKPWGEGCVEYIRTDVIIKEICEWLKTNYTEFLDSSRLGINMEELTKDLRNDFKTE